jgi:hypothetical protein
VARGAVELGGGAGDCVYGAAILGGERRRGGGRGLQQIRHVAQAVALAAEVVDLLGRVAGGLYLLYLKAQKVQFAQAGLGGGGHLLKLPPVAFHGGPEFEAFFSGAACPFVEEVVQDGELF